jgi:hypothetical protein
MPVSNLLLVLPSLVCRAGEYTKQGCGGAGPFPAFRRLDCDNELKREAWAFYGDFAQNCLKGSDGIPPSIDPSSPVAPTPTAPTPTGAVPTPAVAPIVKPPKPTAKVDGPTPRPYLPSGDSGSPADAQPTSQPKKKKSHFFRNFLLLCIMGGGGYFYYKRRSDTFNFVRYRRARAFDYDSGAGESHMYSSLNNSTTFEPPSLPPTPASMGPMGNYNPIGNFNAMSNMGTQMT